MGKKTRRSKKFNIVQGKINCGASSVPEIVQNNFLITRMIEFLDIRYKCRKSGLEAPLIGGIGERERWRAREKEREGKWREREGGSGESLP